MERPDTTQHDSPFDQIKPADLTLGSSGIDAATDAGQRKAGGVFWRGVMIGGLVALALLVILLLPSYVSKSKAPGVDIEPLPAGAQKPLTPEKSPWQEAQLGKLRSTAQDILEQLLDRQLQLEQIAVEQWAAEEFASALTLAGEGDEHYRNREFQEAIAAYETGLELMDGLLARKEVALNKALADGDAAIMAGNSEAASSAFERALGIDPASAEALNGLERAGVLDEVRNLLAQAMDLEKGGSEGAALALLKQAAGLDPEDRNIQDGIARLRAQIDQNEFRRQMSSGYQALSGEDYNAAIAAFKAALRLEGQSVEAREALGQAESARNLRAVNTHLDSAETFVKQEEWAKALGEYDLAMEIDDTLVLVKKLRAESAVRARLDAGLQDAITRPERLTSEEVWQAAKELYRQASAIENPGPKLSRQLSILQQSLQDAVTPVVVTFSSDNLSQVMLYKVAQLGSFSTRQIELKPGNYVMVASREGFRDVRKEFTVEPRSQSLQVTIQCDEQI